MLKRKKLLYISSMILCLFIIYTLIVKFYDVQTIGPNGTKVGLAGINGFLHNKIGLNMFWYDLTKYLGIIPFLIVLYYGLIGLKQLIQRKKISKVDKKLIYLGIFYIIVGITYILFEKIVINYRPVLLDGELEASYPSSHTILAITICYSSLLMSKYYIKNKQHRKIFNIMTQILMIVLIIGRLLSGVHWLTDIVGGVIISVFLISVLYAFITTIKEKK